MFSGVLNMILIAALMICAKDSINSSSTVQAGSNSKVDIDQSKKNEYNLSIIEIQDKATKLVAESISGVTALFITTLGFFIYFKYWPLFKSSKTPCHKCMRQAGS